MKEYWKSLTGGILIFRKSFLSKFLPATIIANLVFGMLNAILPAYASARGGSQWYGFYQSAETIGIMVGAALAPLLKNIPLGKLTIGGFLFCGTTWLISFFSANNYLSILLYAVSLLATGVTNILFVSALQKAVPKEHLAQIYTILMSFGGCAMPLGSLAGGQIAHLWGVAPVFISIGLSFLFVSLYWTFQRILRYMPAAEQLGTGEYTISFSEQAENK